jgi:methylenetetrahydrofolate dehydrogenase (NADP+)/methenyltetrahydrofolate cyclohydrolase
MYTPRVVQLLRRNGVKLDGAEVVIVGRSNIVGKPPANMLIQKSKTGNATVTVCHTPTKNIAEHVKRADIVIAAADGLTPFTSEMVKVGAVVIDSSSIASRMQAKKTGIRCVRQGADVDL